MPRDTVGLTVNGEKTILGYKVYRYVSAGGVTRLLAPDLNLFSLLTESPKGLREEVIGVVRGEPAPELFVPSPGASVRRARDMNDLLSVKRLPQ
jgi:hypothetical protein